MQQLNFLEFQDDSAQLEPCRLDIPDADVVFYERFFSPKESERIFGELLNQTAWRHDSINLFGKTMPLPRLTAWYGDMGKSYTYSGIPMDPEPWTPTLKIIKSSIERVCDVDFNSVLLNLYRDGNDSVAWHSDDEPELGENPVIGSVSFGATRKFSLKHKTHPDMKVSLDLTSGSLLVMSGETQHHWLHQIPKTSRKVAPRINLTFRVIN
jgi:DNA-N1-methyladenine dioxygenase (EC 1.14.11.-)